MRQKYYKLAEQIRLLKKQNKELTEELKSALQIVKELKKQRKQKSLKPIDYLKDLERMEKRAVREARKRRPDRSNEYLIDFLQLVDKDTSKSIEYKDEPIVKVFMKVAELIKEGYNVETRGVRQDVDRPFNLSFETVKAFEAFRDNFWDRYDADSILFTGSINYSAGINFKKIKRSKYVTGVHYEFDIEEYEGKYSYIPSSKNCFAKCCWWILNKEGYEVDDELILQYYRDFLLDQSNRKGMMTLARISPFNEGLNYKLIHYSEETRKFKPVNTRTNQKFALYLKGAGEGSEPSHHSGGHFCVISIANTKLGIDEISKHYKEVKTVINESNLTTSIYSPNTETMELRNHLSNILVYDLVLPGQTESISPVCQRLLLPK